MNYRTSLLAAGAAAALAGLSTAQNTYSFNWHNMTEGFLGGLVAGSGPQLFGFGQTAGPNFAGPGDSVRICHGIDSTQGGRQQTGAASDVNWFTLVQGYAAANAVGNQAVDIGLVSIHAASVNLLSGDACTTAGFPQVDPGTGNPVTVNDSLSFAFIPGQIGVGNPPFPSYTFAYFQFTGAPGPGGALLTANTLGTAGNGSPLLTHLIMEVQGPANGTASNNQYYIASTSGVIGLGNGTSGSGGVTNGNSNQGQAIFGVSADASNAVSYNRLTSNGPSGAFIATNTAAGGGPGTDQWFGHLATQTPALWASQNGNTGGGGPDWAISNQNTVLNLRVLDMRSGAEGSGSPFFNPTGTPTSVTSTTVAVNAPVFLYSATFALGMPQQPMSWSSPAGAGGPWVPGFIPLNTLRNGFQNLALNFDAVSAAFLANSALSFGSGFRTALEPSLEGAATLFEDGAGENIGGSAGFGAFNGLTSTGIPAGPFPNAAGRKIGVQALGLRIDFAVEGGALRILEGSSSLELQLQ